MCLLTTQTEPKIADKDITTYKLFLYHLSIRGKLQSPHSTCHWDIGIMKKRKIRKAKSTKSFCGDDAEYYRKKNQKIFYFGQGLHSCTNRRFLDRFSHFRTMYKCIIPKGSEYYTGYKGLTISNQLIVIKEL